MREQEAIVLLADDPVALVDVPALAEAHGWALEIEEAAAHSRFALSRQDSSDGAVISHV